jgi:DNA-directed RNA polymerase specialized sigma24 family protein
MLLSITGRISGRRYCWLSGRTWIPMTERAQVWEHGSFQWPNTAKKFRDKNDKMKKGDEAVDSNSVFVEQDRDQPRIIEEFAGKLRELNRRVFTMYLDDSSYAKISTTLGVDEVNLRKRMSRIKEQFKTQY